MYFAINSHIATPVTGQTCKKLSKQLTCWGSTININSYSPFWLSNFIASFWLSSTEIQGASKWCFNCQNVLTTYGEQGWQQMFESNYHWAMLAVELLCIGNSQWRLYNTQNWLAVQRIFNITATWSVDMAE